MARRSSIGVCCNWGCGKSLVGSIVLATLVASCDWKYFNKPHSITIDTTHTATRPIANLPICQMLTSFVSWPGWGLWEYLVSSMFQNLLQVRGILRHEGALLQL